MRTIQRIETALLSSDKAEWLSLISANADAAAASDFFDAAVPRGVTRVVVHERDRLPLDGALPGDGYRMIVEVFIESGTRGQLSTWRLDLRRPTLAAAAPDGTDTPWRIIAQDKLTQLDVLHRLEINRERMFQARNMVLTSVDFELKLADGIGVRRRHGGRRHGAGAARRWPDDVCADAEDRARPGAALCRRREGREPLRHGVRAGQPLRLRSGPVGRHADERRRRRAIAVAGPRRLRRRSVALVQPRSERHEPRHLVDSAAARRPPRRSAHAPLAHTHLRARRCRSRRRDVLHARAAEEHRHLCLAAETGQPRSVLRRRRPHGVRHPRSRARHRGLPGAPVDCRDVAHDAARQVVHARSAHSQTGRQPDRVVGHEPGAGPPAVPQGAQPELVRRQPAGCRTARLRTDAHHSLPGPTRPSSHRLGVAPVASARRDAMPTIRSSRRSRTGC